MSNSAYRRAKFDMEAAGLNPAMMYGGGGGGPSTTPSGGQASAPSPQPLDMSGLMQGLTEGISSAIAIKMKDQEFKNLKEQERAYKLANYANLVKIPAMKAGEERKLIEDRWSKYWMALDQTFKRLGNLPSGVAAAAILSLGVVNQIKKAWNVFKGSSKDIDNQTYNFGKDVMKDYLKLVEEEMKKTGVKYE